MRVGDAYGVWCAWGVDVQCGMAYGGILLAQHGYIFASSAIELQTHLPFCCHFTLLGKVCLDLFKACLCFHHPE